MANVITDEISIINQVLAELRTLDDANEANVFLAAYPIWLPMPPGDWYIELVMGVGQDKAAKHPIGWMLDSFSVCIFRRLLVDQSDYDTKRIADESLGVLRMVLDVQTKLTESFLAGMALVPVLPDRRESGERNPEDPYDGWVMMRRTFRLEYLYAFPGPHSTSR